MTIPEILEAINATRDPRMREINGRFGNDHSANLSQLRLLAKKLKTDNALAAELWATGDTDARLLAVLVFKPKALSADVLDAMVHDITTAKLLDWYVGYVVKKSVFAEALRGRWKDAPAPLVARAGWSLTTDRVVKSPDGLDLSALLDEIEAHMKDAPAPKQWSMNHCLAEIGIHNPSLRARAVAIGEKLEVLKDYPTSPGCTSPYAPLWIGELVRRQEGRE